MKIRPKAEHDALRHALALHRMGDLEAAASLYDAILKNHPRESNALRLLGVIRLQQGKLDAAESLISKAIKINRHSPDAHYFLGRVFLQKNDAKRAAAALNSCIAIDPRHENALVMLGCIESDAGHTAAGIGLFERAAAINPNSADALVNLAKSFERLKRYEDALACYDRLIKIDPRHTDALCSAGLLLGELGRFDEALACYTRALELKPDLALAYHRRGGILAERTRYPEAVSDFRRARELDPTIAYSLGFLVHARQYLCDWPMLDAECAHLIADLRAGKPACVPFALLAIDVTPADQLKCASALVAERYPQREPVWRGERYAHDRIRVGYVSADFREQPMPLLTVGMFEKHDRSRFETVAVSLNADEPGPIRDRLRAAFDRFIDAHGKSDEQIAALLREMEIDIAVDLMGHTRHARTGVFAMRPAPIQAAYMGFAGTMGAPFIDYLVADRTVVPPTDRDHYSEKIVYLPDTYYVYDDTRPVSPLLPTRREADLPDDGFVFCSFNQAYKYTPAIFDLWMRLLRAVDGSALWLLEPHETAKANLRREAQSRGIDADRIVFAPRIALTRHEHYLARHRLADLFLDTPVYNSHTTACDALWAGLPVLTCLGTTFAGRVAASLLNAVGLPEMVTHSLADYEALALKLAREPAALADIKAKLARNRTTHPLFDTARFTRHLEAAYIGMWGRQQRGEPPASFAIEPAS